MQSRHSSAHQVAFFLRELADATAARRLAAVKGLGSVGAREALPQLMAAARDDTDPAVRAAAMCSIGRLASTGAAEVLLTGLVDDEAEVRVAAARALPATDATGPEVVAALGAALADDEWKVREAAATHLGRLGVATADVVDALIAALGRHGGWKLGIAWWAAYRALEQLAGQPVTAQRLRHGLRSAPAGASRYGCLLLLRRHAPDEIRALAVAALTDSFQPVRHHAAYLLIERPHADNVGALTAALAAEQDQRTRSAIEQALGSVGDSSPR